MAMGLIVLERDAWLKKSDADAMDDTELRETTLAMVNNLAQQFLSVLPQFLHVRFEYNEYRDAYNLKAAVKIESPGGRRPSNEEFAEWIRSMQRLLPDKGVKMLPEKQEQLGPHNGTTTEATDHQGP